GRPANDDAFDRGMGAKAEVQLALILRAETGAARDFLKLLPSIPEDLDLRTDGAAIRARAAAGVAAAASFQLKANPVAVTRHGVLVEQQRPALIGDDRIERAAAVEIGQRN